MNFFAKSKQLFFILVCYRVAHIFDQTTVNYTLLLVCSVYIDFTYQLKFLLIIINQHFSHFKCCNKLLSPDNKLYKIDVFFCVDLDGRYELKNKINNIQTVMQNVHCSIDYDVHFIAYNVQFIVYNVHCIDYNVHVLFLSVCLYPIIVKKAEVWTGPTCLGHHVIPGKV